MKLACRKFVVATSGFSGLSPVISILANRGCLFEANICEKRNKINRYIQHPLSSYWAERNPDLFTTLTFKWFMYLG